jgi:hypothetical protein
MRHFTQRSAKRSRSKVTQLSVNVVKPGVGVHGLSEGVG